MRIIESLNQSSKSIKDMNVINHLHSYQLLPILASTSKATNRSFSKGCYILCLTISNAYFADYSGPSNINSSWICISSFHPNYFNLSFLAILIIAAITISAAPPWIGVLIDLRIHIPLKFLGAPGLKNLSSLRFLPNKVNVYFLFSAILCLCYCQALTSRRSLNQASIIFLASSTEQFQSLANPTAVFP